MLILCLIISFLMSNPIQYKYKSTKKKKRHLSHASDTFGVGCKLGKTLKYNDPQKYTIGKGEHTHTAHYMLT